LVRHVIDEMGYSADALHKGKVEREVVEKSLLVWLEEELKQEIQTKPEL